MSVGNLGTLDENYTDPNQALWLSALDFLNEEGYSEGLSVETVAGMLQRFVLKMTRKHVYWAAGEPDCPREIKAPNGELHTLRCKVCGLDSPKSFCEGVVK